MTLDELKAEMGRESLPPMAATLGNNDVDAPWWVVIANPRRQPFDPKFHGGHASVADAEVARQALQEKADNAAKLESRRRNKDWPAHRYYVVSRP